MVFESILLKFQFDQLCSKLFAELSGSGQSGQNPQGFSITVSVFKVDHASKFLGRVTCKSRTWVTYRPATQES